MADGVIINPTHAITLERRPEGGWRYKNAGGEIVGGGCIVSYPSGSSAYYHETVTVTRPARLEDFPPQVLCRVPLRWVITPLLRKKGLLWFLGQQSVIPD